MIINFISWVQMIFHLSLRPTLKHQTCQGIANIWRINCFHWIPWKEAHPRFYSSKIHKPLYVCLFYVAYNTVKNSKVIHVPQIPKKELLLSFMHKIYQIRKLETNEI